MPGLDNILWGIYESEEEMEYFTYAFLHDKTNETIVSLNVKPKEIQRIRIDGARAYYKYQPNLYYVSSIIFFLHDILKTV